MKLTWSSIQKGLQDAGAEVERQLRSDAELIRTEVGKIDWKKVDADLDEAGAQAMDLAKSAMTRTRSFVAEAREAWTTHRADARKPAPEAPSGDARSEAARAGAALEEVAAAPDPVAAQRILQSSSPEEMQAGVQHLTERWTTELGERGAQVKLDALQASLDAAQTVARTHDQRARSVPRHQGRPDPVSPGLSKAVTGLQGAVDRVKATLTKAELPDVYSVSSGASEGLWSTGEKVAKGAAGWAGRDGGGRGISEAVGQARRRLGEAIDGASPEWLKTRYQSAKRSIGEATQQAETVLNGLDGLEAEAKDRDAMFARLDTALAHAKNAMDPEADAVAVGYLKEAAGGASGGRGKELVYLRETGELRVVDLKMTGARLAVGASKRPFARSLYGKAEVMKKTSHRHTGEVGAMIFHVGSSTARVDGEKDPVKSWHGTLGIGFNASLPLVGDQSVYSIREETLATHTLTDAQRAKLEAHLEAVPKSSRGWTSVVRDLVGHAPRRAR